MVASSLDKMSNLPCRCHEALAAAMDHTAERDCIVFGQVRIGLGKTSAARGG